MKALVPANEAARLEALRQYEILNTEGEEIFDDITRLAAYTCQTPIAVISFVDRDRQWFKARVGLDARETSRDCASVLTLSYRTCRWSCPTRWPTSDSATIR